MMANLSRVENTVRFYRQNLLVNFDDWLAPTFRRLAKQGRGDGRRSACLASSLNIGRANVSQDAQGEPETDALSVALRPRQTKCRRHSASGEWASHGWLARPASGAGTAERSSYLIVRRAPRPASETRSTRPIPFKLARQAEARSDPPPFPRIGDVLRLECLLVSITQENVEDRFNLIGSKHDRSAANQTLSMLRSIYRRPCVDHESLRNPVELWPADVGQPSPLPRRIGHQPREAADSNVSAHETRLLRMLTKVWQ